MATLDGAARPRAAVGRAARTARRRARDRGSPCRAGPGDRPPARSTDGGVRLHRGLLRPARHHWPTMPGPYPPAVHGSGSTPTSVGVAGRRGYDAAKRVVGRKRHALVDTDGRLLLAASRLPTSTTAMVGSHSCGPRGARGLSWRDGTRIEPMPGHASQTPRPSTSNSSGQSPARAASPCSLGDGSSSAPLPGPGAAAASHATMQPCRAPPSPFSSSLPPPSSSGDWLAHHEVGPQPVPSVLRKITLSSPAA